MKKKPSNAEDKIKKSPTKKKVDTPKKIKLAPKESAPDKVEQQPKKSLKPWLILAAVMGALLILVFIAWRAIEKSQSENYQSENARKKMLDIFAKESKRAELKKVESTFGFSVQYDSEQLNARGQVQNKESKPGVFEGYEYNGKDLEQKRPYGIVKIEFKDIGGKKIESTSSDTIPSYTPIRPSISIVSNRHKDFFNREKWSEEDQKKTNLDIMVEGKRRSIEKDSPNSKIEVQDIKIAGVEYKILKESYGFESAGKTVYTSETRTYMTVQNDRPYWLSIYNIKPETAQDVPILEAIIASVKYQPPKQEDFVFKGGKNQQDDTAIALATAKSEMPDDTAHMPDKLREDTIINVVAKNQPATVRVGAIRCANINYRAENGASLAVNNVCTAAIGSGSIVSGDGYIVTNGHVADGFSDEQLASYLFHTKRSAGVWNAYYEFLVNAGYATKDELIELYNKVKAGDQEASSKLLSLITLVPKQNISLSNEKKKYVIQTSNDPIRFSSLDQDDQAIEWQYNKTNISAELIDSEVKKDGGPLKYEDPETDVAILKASGSFPSVEMGSIDQLKNGDFITAIGFPAVVDGGTATKKSYTVPSVTQGYIEQLGKIGGGHSIFHMSTQIAAGNSGGPSFDVNGKQVGINTYGGARCASDAEGTNSCFGKGTARDIKDAKTMLSKNNIRIKAGGELTELWHRGLNEFLRGQYSVAAKTFTQLDSKYPDNYLVKKFIEVASAQEDELIGGEGSVGDKGRHVSTSKSDHESATAVIIFAAIMIGSIFIFTIVVIIIIVSSNARRKNQFSPHASNQYGHPQQTQGPYQSQQHQQIPPQQPTFSGPPIQQPQSPYQPPQQQLQPEPEAQPTEESPVEDSQSEAPAVEQSVEEPQAQPSQPEPEAQPTEESPVEDSQSEAPTVEPLGEEPQPQPSQPEPQVVEEDSRPEQLSEESQFYQPQPPQYQQVPPYYQQPQQQPAPTPPQAPQQQASPPHYQQPPQPQFQQPQNPYQPPQVPPQQQPQWPAIEPDNTNDNNQGGNQ